MFIVVFLIMLPIYLKTHDALLAWQLGPGVVPRHRRHRPARRVRRADRCGKYTPRAAMLGTLAGISIAFISMRPAFPDAGRSRGSSFAVADDRAGQLDGRRASALWPAGRACRGHRGHGARLARQAGSPRRSDAARRGRRRRSSQFGLHLPYPSSDVVRRSATLARCWSRPCRSASTTSPKA